MVPKMDPFQIPEVDGWTAGLKDLKGKVFKESRLGHDYSPQLGLTD